MKWNSRELMQKTETRRAIREKSVDWADDVTATAMNTASQKSKEVEKLKRELDKSKEFASIKAAEIRLKSKFDWKAAAKLLHLSRAGNA